MRLRLKKYILNRREGIRRRVSSVPSSSLAFQLSATVQYLRNRWRNSSHTTNASDGYEALLLRLEVFPISAEYIFQSFSTSCSLERRPVDLNGQIFLQSFNPTRSQVDLEPT